MGILPNPRAEYNTVFVLYSIPPVLSIFCGVNKPARPRFFTLEYYSDFLYRLASPW